LFITYILINYKLIKKYIILFYFLLKELFISLNNKTKMGIGDWGLGIGDWGLSPIPNPQSPIPMNI
jgi:hypothetical protein